MDLHKMVRKYMGETQKNSAHHLDRAYGKRSVPFFAEADALFGKRNRVKDAHDR